MWLIPAIAGHVDLKEQTEVFCNGCRDSAVLWLPFSEQPHSSSISAGQQASPVSQVASPAACLIHLLAVYSAFQVTPCPPLRPISLSPALATTDEPFMTL